MASVLSKPSKEALIKAIQDFGQEQTDKLCQLDSGVRFITEGEISKELFLIIDGEVSILVRQPDGRTERQVALRSSGEIVGETAFLQKNSPRTASVEVFSDNATLIRLTQDDVFEIMTRQPELKETVIYFTQLKNQRSLETMQVLQGNIHVENRMMSALLADIHNFTGIGEFVWEEHLNSFLFEFIEGVDEIVELHAGTFEEQGDGFKALFEDNMHARKSVKCAIGVQALFVRLRDHWRKYNEAFANLGIGIGICSGAMSVRKRFGSRRSGGHVFSHAINIAAAISKYRTNPSDTSINIDDVTLKFLGDHDFNIDPPQQRWLEKLGRIYQVYNVRIASQVGLSIEVQQLIEAHEKRLQKLQLKAATEGRDTPPQVQIEIEEIEANIRKLRNPKQ
jgi:class 3 adenylate cyclase